MGKMTKEEIFTFNRKSLDKMFPYQEIISLSDVAKWRNICRQTARKKIGEDIDIKNMTKDFVARRFIEVRKCI